MVETKHSLGMDADGITEISLASLRSLAEAGYILESIEIGGNNPSDVICSFIFKDHGVYTASGFSIGYGGEGPRGLHQAIMIFHPDGIDPDFDKTAISKLTLDRNWKWTPNRGFAVGA